MSPPNADSGVGCADGTSISSPSSAISPTDTAGRSFRAEELHGLCVTEPALPPPPPVPLLLPLPRLEPAAVVAPPPPSVDEWSDSGVRGEAPVESCAVLIDRGDPDIMESMEVEPDLVPRLSPLLRALRSLPLPSSEPDPPLRGSSKSGGKATWTSASANRCWCCRRADMVAPPPPPVLSRGSKPGGASSFRGEALPWPELLRSGL